MAGNSAVTKVQKKKYDNQTLSECIKKLYLVPEIADVYFSIESVDGSTERVPAHKSLLAAVSDVFKAMFYGQLKEDGDVKMTDVTVAALKEFLQFFYLGQIELTEENVVEVMHLGNKYNVTKCVDVCVQFLKDTLTDDNICTALGLAILYDQNQLMKLCEKRIVVKSSAVLKSNGFLDCDKRVLEYILKMNWLSCSETDVFEACMEWVKVNSKQDVVSKELVEAHLGDLFYEIRFKSMTMQQFATLAASYDSVLSTDFKDIANLIALPDYQPKKFNKSPRQVRWNEDAIIKCSRGIDGKDWEFPLNGEEMSTFSTNKPVLLGGFVCERVVVKHNVFKDLRANLSVEVKIAEDSSLGNKSENIVLNMKANLESKGTTVLLPTPILIRPGHFYTIHLSQFPERHYFYTKELMTEIKIDPNITIKFHNDIKYDDDDNVTEKVSGLIPVLMFNNI